MDGRRISAVVVSLALAACSAASSGTAGPPYTTGDDAGTDVIKQRTYESTVVLVNALTSDAIGDVRVCPAPSNALAVPSAPVALTNYPGLGRGRGVDLGKFDVSGGIDVFSAAAIKDKVGNCGTLRNGNTYTHVTVPPVGKGPVAIVLVDDAKGAVTAKVVALGVGVTPTSDQVAAQFAFAGTGLTATTLTLTFQSVSAQGGTAAASPGFLLEKKNFDASVEVSDGASFTYSQSLASIQYVSDPTTDPATFFDPRTQYLFVLVGDPTDPYTAYKSPDKLTGRELHVTAVPFALVAQ